VSTSGPYEVVLERNVRMPMRDGVRLATDLFLPSSGGQPLPGPWPALLTRTPYDKEGRAERARFFASHGYLSVTQDVRGTRAMQLTCRVLRMSDGLEIRPEMALAAATIHRNSASRQG